MYAYLLADEHALKAAQLEAAARLGNVRVDQSKLPRLLKDWSRVLHGLIVVAGDRDHLVLGKVARELLERFLIGDNITTVQRVM